MAATPRVVWKMGKLVEVAEVREVAGAGATGMQVGNMGMAQAGVAYATIRGFVVSGDDFVWMVQIRSIPRGFHPRLNLPNVTINGRVLYRFENARFYLLDDDGKQFEMTVMRKRAVTPADLAPPK
jgi:hypothetical protein